MLKLASYEVVFQEVPDEVTLSMNISNCPNGCKGCHSAQLMGDIGEPFTDEYLMGLLEAYGNQVTCFCFMGGDVDPNEVQRLAGIVRKVCPDLRVGWYSGRQELPSGIDPGRFDYIKLGPYVEELGPLKSRTTNQRMYRVCDGVLSDITDRFWK